MSETEDNQGVLAKFGFKTKGNHQPTTRDRALDFLAQKIEEAKEEPEVLRYALRVLQGDAAGMDDLAEANPYRLAQIIMADLDRLDELGTFYQDLEEWSRADPEITTLSDILASYAPSAGLE